jgi:aminoglycoside phosphotransferase (APT) family kinase protein
LTDGQQVVLKVAPPADVNVLTYEQHLMVNEVLAMKAMFSQHILVPDVLYYDDSKTVIDSAYFFMSYLEGTPLNKVRETLSPSELHSIQQSLGSMMHTMHKNTYSVFGELGNMDKQFTDWFTCYRSMISDLMDDAKNIELSLPILKKDLLALVDEYQSDLAEVKASILVHKYLWDGNVFIHSDTKQLSGIIDCERALYADPLLEIVCGHYTDNPAFIDSYYPNKDFDESAKNRLLLYELYLFLLMVIECPYRQYPTDDQFNWAWEQLEKVLNTLS